MILEKIREKNNLPIILFFVIFINYIPIIFANMFTKESFGADMFQMVLCFGIEIIILILFLCKKIKFTKNIKKEIVILCTVSLILFIIQVKNFIIKDYKIMDFANIACQFVNIFLLYVCIKDFKIAEEKILVFMKVIMILGLVACIQNMILYFSEILCFFGIDTGATNHIKSFFSNRNQFAFFLYIAIIANVFVLTRNKNIFYKMSIGIFIVNMFFSMSRTGILIILIFAIVYFIMSKKINKKTKIIVLTTTCICGIMFGVIINYLNPNVLSRIIRLDSIANLSGRTEIWERGFYIILDNPINFLFGVGRFKGIEVLEFETKTFTQFHNIYIDSLITGGILELMFIIYIYFNVIKTILKCDMDEKYKALYKAIYITYFIYICFESLGRFSIGASDTLCLIFFVTIPLLHANSIKNEKTEEE